MTDDPKRTPIKIDLLIFTSPNPNGAPLPSGPTGDNVQLTPRLKAGMNSNDKVEIEYRPWQRAFRIARSRRVTSADAKGKEVETFTPLGRPFYVHESWCVYVPAEEV